MQIPRQYAGIFNTAPFCCMLLFSALLVRMRSRAGYGLVELALDFKDAPGSPDASRSALWRFSVEVFADAELA